MEAAAAEISEAAGGNEVFPVQCDVRDADAVKAAIDATVEKFGLPGLPTICILLPLSHGNPCVEDLEEIFAPPEEYS